MNLKANTDLRRREIHPVVRVLDEKQGLVEYTASDETLDSYREIVRADGWRFDDFRKNAPFVDSHNYYSIESMLGRVVGFEVRNRQLVEQVRWAIDVPECRLAQLGFAMTRTGYLRAVSVGFTATKYVTRWDRDPRPWEETCKEMGMDPQNTNCRCIYLEQQQKELSACVVGANPNAVAKAFKAGVLSQADIEFLGNEHAMRSTASATDSPAAVAQARQRAQNEFLSRFEKLIHQI